MSEPWQGYDAPDPQGQSRPAWQSPGYGPQGWGPAGYGPAAYSPHGDLRPLSSEDTTLAVLAHLSFFVAGIIAPLVIFLIKKDTSPFVRAQAAEALNFHITVAAAALVSAVLLLVLIGLLLLPAVIITGTVFAILAAVASGRGENYRYPINLRLVR